MRSCVLFWKPGNNKIETCNASPEDIGTAGPVGPSLWDSLWDKLQVDSAVRVLAKSLRGNTRRAAIRRKYILLSSAQ